MMVLALATILVAEADSPVAVTVVSTEQIEAAHAVRVEDVLRTVPGVTFGDRNITLRGYANWNPSQIRGVLSGASPVEAVGVMAALQQIEAAANQDVRILGERPILGAGQFQDLTYGYTISNVRYGATTLGTVYCPDRAPLYESPVRTYGQPGSGPGRLTDRFSPTFGGIGVQEDGGEALYRGDVPGLSYRISGQGLSTCVAELTNLRDTNLSGRFLPGGLLIPDDSSYQEMITYRETPFMLIPGETKQISLPTFCLDYELKEPAPSVSYEYRLADTIDSNLMWPVNMGIMSGPWDQGRVWMRDGVGLEEINSRLNPGLPETLFGQEWQKLVKHGGFTEEVEDLVGSSSVALANILAGDGPQPLWWQAPSGLSDAIEGLKESRNGEEKAATARLRLALSLNLEMAALGGDWNQWSPFYDLRVEAGGDPLHGELLNLSQCLHAAGMIGEDVAACGACPPIDPTGPADPVDLSFTSLPEDAVAPGAATIAAEGGTGHLTAGDPFGEWSRFGDGLKGDLSYSDDFMGIRSIGAHSYANGRMSSIYGTIAYCPAFAEVVFANPDSTAAELYRQARAAGTRARNAQRRANDATRQANRARSAATALWAATNEMACIDRCLDGLRAMYEQPIKNAVAENDNLGGGAPGTDLDKAAKDARAAADKCKAELAAMKGQLGQLDNQINNLKAQQDALLNQIDGIYMGAGAVGDNGYHSDGRYHFGYVLDGKSLPADQERQVSQAKSQLRRLNRQYRRARAQKAKLEADIKAKEAECAQLEAAAKAAETAKANADKIAANNAILDAAWTDIAGRLGKFAKAKTPQARKFAGRANALIARRPRTQAEWDKFWADVDALIADKKKDEAASRAAARAEDKKAADAAAAAAAAQTAAAEAEAERKRKAAAAAATAEAEREAAARAEQLACAKAFAEWVKQYPVTEDNLKALQHIQTGLETTGEVAKGVASGLTQGLGTGAGAGLTSVASGVVTAGAGLFYAYAKYRIEGALEKLGKKIDDHRMLEISLMIDGNKKWGSFKGGVTEAGTKSYFYFRQGDKIMVFEGGESGVRMVGVGTMP